MHVVEIYTKTFCPYCWRAKALLDAKGVEYRRNRGRFRRRGEREEMIQRANGRTTVPQIFIGEHSCRRLRRSVALERAGKLDELIAA